MCTQSQLNIVSQLVVECYRRVYGIDRIKSIILYGSYARGDYDSNSDIDITAIVSGDREELQNKLKLVWDESAEIGLENDVVVSPTVIPEDEYEKYRNVLPYYKNISMEGRKIG